jgi:hypothetical protein
MTRGFFLERSLETVCVWRETFDLVGQFRVELPQRKDRTIDRSLSLVTPYQVKERLWTSDPP